MPLWGARAERENVCVAAGDVVSAWCLFEAVEESDAGSCCEGPRIVAFEHESPPLLSASLVPPAATPLINSVSNAFGVSGDGFNR